MAFFLTEHFDAPKPSRLFWMCHFLGWGSLALINSLAAIIVGVSLYLGIFTFFLLLTVNTTACLKLRKLIYGKQLLTLPYNKTWRKLALYSITLAAISSACVRIARTIFQVVLPQNDLPEVEIGEFAAFLLNWLSFSIWFFVWGLIFISVNYSNQLREAQKISAELTLELRNAQLNTLISQLKPHFLFNALNNIRGLMLEDVSKSREMITLLAEMLRYSLLSEKQEFATLEKELGVVRAYLQLASIQYEERLQYTEEINMDLLDSKIPPMLIQMLIENAVKYGIDQTATGGEIKLTINSQNEKIFIQVTNPGTLQDEHMESTGLGVENIQKRLKLLYGDEARFSLEQAEDKVIATVALPVVMQTLLPRA